MIGFTLTGGSLSGTNCGAGAYVDDGCLISDCVITDNHAASCTNTLMPSGKGGGLYLHGTALRCTIENNSAWQGGGAYLESGASLADCEIRGNGAGYDVDTVEGVNGYGGGLYLEETASAVNCLIENNTATDGGALFFDHGGYAQDIDSLTNEVDSIGGAGAFLWAGGTLRNGVIEGNISTGQYARGGSGILFYDAGGLVDNSVVADNISSTNNGGINFRYSGDTAPSKLGTVNNSIIWGNLPSQTTVWNGTGNQFVDPDTVSGAPTGANVDDYPYDNALTRTTSYYYDLNGNLVKRVYPSRVVETRTFDALNRLLTMKTETLGKSWFKTEYEYDRVGSMLKRSHTRSDSLSGKAFAATTYWEYDNRYRLTSERFYVTGEPYHFTYYTWDNADNRLTKRVIRGIQTENITYTNNALNQITGWYDSLANSGAGKTVIYVYDNNGNRTNKTVTAGGSSTSTTYVYDYDNRLTQATSGTAVNTFKYDYRSRRYYRSTPTETNLCVFDGGLCVQEYDASDNNLTPHVSRLTTEYLRGPDLGGGVGGMVYSIDHRQSQIGNPIYSHSNHRGDVIARTDGNGSLTWYAVYEAYGTRPFEWSDGTTGNPDRQMANTKEEEAELGLLNEGMRYRDLETGTFLTRDPIRYADGPNMYCYVHCNPITYFDPLGLSWWNPLTSDFAAYTAVKNTGRHLAEAGRQTVSGHPILAVRVTAGIATSTLSGDIFDEKNSVDAQSTGVSVNGIWNNDNAADVIAGDAEKATGQVTEPIKNGTHFGVGKYKIGDVFQCVSEALGAINTPSLNYADTMREIAKNHPNGTLEATAHSQGGSVLNGRAALLDPSINKRTSVQTFGAQLAAPNDGTFADVYNERSSGGLFGDPVPYVDPRNWGNHFSGNIVNHPYSRGHSWRSNYGRYGMDRAEGNPIMDLYTGTY